MMRLHKKLGEAADFVQNGLMRVMVVGFRVTVGS
jgi:hypothetical protein